MVKEKKEFLLSAEERAACVELAKKSIKHFLLRDAQLRLSPEEVGLLPKKLSEKKACFVTLKLGGELRGCIGRLNPIQPLYKDIVENAFSAAFSDPRFAPLTPKEFSGIEIEVSILTDPKELEFEDSADLLKKINAGKDGLIIQRGYSTATFLPSVWEDLKKKEEFLSHLCLKAGLAADDWKKPGLKVQVYKAIKAK